MKLKLALALVFFFKLNFSFAQQVDILPYIGLNNNITDLKLQMQTTSQAEPVTYYSLGAGPDGTTAGFCGGFYTTVTFSNNFGIQSGAGLARANLFFHFTETRPLEFGNTIIYYLKANQLSLPLHLVFDQEIPAGSSFRNKTPKVIRFFGGPVFSYKLNPETRLLKSQVVSSATGTLSTSYSDLVFNPKWEYGLEAGLTVTPLFKDLVSLGLLFQYNFTPAARIYFENQTTYESADTRVAVNNSGAFKVIGSSLMLQVGVKPFILKKE